ncbi:hypothetical protein DCAR_0312139 [Daucus carota subsp. sativus]|uniref:Uncharacterized protein n=1 Tax=Daucus carota subsp. sativus TaxID=79200 RepID=A0A162AJD2_DAUCS|nr:hypothetical protein DCAR_0312139 [Daucus carota subsp. sativus]
MVKRVPTRYGERDQARMLEEGYKPDETDEDSTSEPPANTVIQRTSFRDLIENSVTYRDKVVLRIVIFKFSITKVEEEDNWFRICVLADDSTIVTNVILLDRVVKLLAGTTVANILNESKKDSSVSAPSTVFNRIIGREVTVLLQLSKTNVNGDSNLYNVVDLCDATMYETAMVVGLPSRATTSASVDGVSVDAGLELFQTPGSSQSVTKKIKVVWFLSLISKRMSSYDVSSDNVMQESAYTAVDYLQRVDVLFVFLRVC